VYPVKSFIRHSSEGADDVVLASEQEDEGNLSQRDITSSVANVLKVEKVVQVHVEEAKDGHQYKVSDDDDQSAYSWQRERKATDS